jgi:hypothetical protein
MGPATACGTFRTVSPSPIRPRLPQGSGLLLVPAAALAVHQIRYSLAYGSKANAQLAAQGHSYLHSLAPWTVLALGIGATLFLRRVAGALATGDVGTPRRRSFPALWSLSAVGLLAVYTVQETLESFLSSGHPGGIGGVFGHGGLWAVPASAAVGLVVALVLRAGRVVLDAAKGLAPRLPRQRPLPFAFPVGVRPAVVRPLARSAAGRAPPRSLRLS